LIVEQVQQQIDLVGEMVAWYSKFFSRSDPREKVQAEVDCGRRSHALRLACEADKSSVDAERSAAAEIT